MEINVFDVRNHVVEADYEIYRDMEILPDRIVDGGRGGKKSGSIAQGVRNT